MQKEGQILVDKSHYDALVDISLKYDVLLQQVANLQRAVFGSKSERYLPDPQQLVLDILLPEQKQQTQEQNSNEQSNESGLPKNKAKAQPKRKPLPKELARIIKDIYPEGDLTGLKYLGYESSERLAITAPKLFVEETRRHKYVKADGQGVLIAPVPASVLPKSIAATSLICYILTSKFLDHLPFYRIISLLKRNGIELKDSTLNDWYSGVVDNYLIRLYERINEILVRCSYLQMDETFIRVMDKIMNKGSTHLGIKEIFEQNWRIGYIWIQQGYRFHKKYSF